LYLTQQALKPSVAMTTVRDVADVGIGASVATILQIHWSAMLLLPIVCSSEWLTVVEYLYKIPSEGFQQSSVDGDSVFAICLLLRTSFSENNSNRMRFMNAVPLTAIRF
jgi:hypothetical protein